MKTHGPLADTTTPSAETWNGFVEAAEPLRGELFSFGLRLTRNPFDGEDLVQEALIRAFGAAAFQEGDVGDLRSYLFRTMANLWIDHRRRVREVLFEAVEVADTGSDGGIETVAGLRAAVERLFSELAPRERAAIVLHDSFGYRHREIADMLTTTEGAIRSALHRARTRLSQVEGDPNGEDGGPKSGVGAVDGAGNGAAPRPAPGASSGADRAAVDGFVEAFSAGNITALRRLLADGAEANVFPAGVGHGADFAAEQGWLQGCLYHHQDEYQDSGTPFPNHLQVTDVAGEPVVLVSRRGDGGILLEEVWRFETVDGLITRVSDYGFCPDLVSHVGSLLSIPVRRGAYRFGVEPRPPS
ncbi:MAG: sigma-70 family RNA polymerase sigma factor [Acidimicrobiales bacterium]